MTFDAYESSSESGEPIALFHFTNGATEYLYTTHTEDVEYDSKTYTPIPIKHDKISTSGDMVKAQLKITIDWASELALVMRGSPPSKSISLILRRGHIADPDQEYIVSWTGLVLGSSRKGSTVTLTCDSVASAVRGLGLGRDYQLTCPYILYDATYCTASEAAATAATAPINVASRVLTLPSGWRGANDLVDYLHGMVRWAGGNGAEVRSIIKVSGTEDIKLGGAPHDIAIGQSISVILGCTRRTDACENLHNNIVNFGGQPYIPLENPIRVNNF